MKIYLPQDFQENILHFLKKNGYTPDPFSSKGKLSFSKRITSYLYPRFHIYLHKEISGRRYLSLHLDQKQPRYEKQRAHMAEYHGEIVDREASKIQRAIYQSIHLRKTQREKKR